MKEIGGYFELELNKGREYHKGALRLNSGANCLEYLLRAKKYKKVYIPRYTCEVILDKCKVLGVDHEFYSVDLNLDPVFSREVKTDEAFIYTNYYGIKGNTVQRLAEKNIHLIVDNAQAFFCKRIDGVDSFCSARKFFGVPDGGYLYTDITLDEDVLQDCSANRLVHLIKRIEKGASAGYKDFRVNEVSLSNQAVRSMSEITKALLCNVNYKKVANIRNQNFMFLHNILRHTNNLEIHPDDDFVPMVYPFVSGKTGLRELLISRKIYVAQYWPNVLEWSGINEIEHFLAANLVPLPVDQRYKLSDMREISNIVRGYV